MLGAGRLAGVPARSRCPRCARRSSPRRRSCSSSRSPRSASCCMLGGPGVLDARGRDLPPDRAAARPADGRGAGDRAARGGRRARSPCTGRIERRRRPRACGCGPRRRRPRGPAAPRAGDCSCGNLVAMALLLGAPLAVLVERSLHPDGGYGLRRSTGRCRTCTAASTLFVSPVEAIRNSLVFAVGRDGDRARRRRAGRVRARPAGAAHGPAAASTRCCMLPLGTSAVTVGFGFLIALDEPPLDLRTSPVARSRSRRRSSPRRSWSGSMLPVLRSIDPRLREAAAVLGAAAARASGARSTCRSSRRALLVAAGFAFAISLGEFGATLFIARPDTPTLPVAIYRLLGRPGALNFGAAMAASTILMALTAVAILAIERFRGRRRRRVLMLDASTGADACDYGGAPALDGRRPDRRPTARSCRVLGPSGSGQEHAAARRSPGSSPPARGTVGWDGGDLAGVPPHRRRSGSCSRTTRSSRTATCAGNVDLRAAHAARRPGRRRTARVGELLELVGLGGFERRTVAELSGGEQQRVALARALAPAPRLLMLDEPLGSLDRPLRERLMVELRELFTGLALTALYVTHDHDEAFALADRVAVMRAGRHRAGRHAGRRLAAARERVRRPLPRLQPHGRVRRRPGAVRPDGVRLAVRRPRRRDRRGPHLPARPLPPAGAGGDRRRPRRRRPRRRRPRGRRGGAPRGRRRRPIGPLVGP